jgi:hypothetical protein
MGHAISIFLGHYLGVVLATMIVFTLDGLNTFLSRLRSFKLPIDYGAALVKHVVDKKFGSMKSHDYYMLL